MAKKISDLNDRELEKIVRSTSDPKKLARLISGLLSKAYEEGIEQGEIGSQGGRSGFGY